MTNTNSSSLVGHQPFGRLTVTKDAEPIIGNKGRLDSGKPKLGKIHRSWVQCACGSPEYITRNQNLLSGSTRSCGCLARELTKARSTTHGHYSGGKASRTYRSWCSMLSRCTNPNAHAYENYGGRGIRVCSRWRDSFENFLADMGERPAGMTLDRKDNDLNYTPENCVWSVPKYQSRNKRNNKVMTALGMTGPISFLAEHFGLRPGVVYMRIHYGWPIERALTTPVRRRSS